MVTDNDLDRAAELQEPQQPDELNQSQEPQEPEPQEPDEPQEPQEPDEPQEPQEPEITDDHAERSRLGRKVKKLEDTLTKMTGQMEALLNYQQTAASQKETQFDPEDNAPMTKGELAQFMDDYIDKKETTRQQADKKYE